MSNQSLGDRVQARLAQAIESGLLPEDVQKTATMLLARLQQPVRLALLGMPESGKSAILNLLVGEEILPEGLKLPTLQMLHGDIAVATCTLPDGTRTEVEGADPNAVAALHPVFVEMRLPLPALKKISLLEVVAPDDITAMQRATQWAAKRADMAIWCTQGYTAAEQQVWAQMPDAIKDHALLMLTQADVLEDQGVLTTTLEHVRGVAKDEFNQILPIATLSAIASRFPDGTVNKDKMRGSGGSALISSVLKQVDLGRQSTVDTADVLLLQNEAHLANLDEVMAAKAAAQTTPAPAEKPAPAAKAAPAPEPAPAPSTPPPAAEAPEPAPAAPKPKPAPGIPAQSPAMARLRAIAERKRSELIEVEKSTPAPPPAPAPEVAETAPEPEAPAAEAEPAAQPLSPATRAAYEHVLDYLAKNAGTLEAALQGDGDAAASEVMALSVDHIQWVTDYLNENGDDMDPSLQRARDTAFDAADLVQLMQMEKRDSAALEGVTLMLQIKRELQADLAA